VSVFSSGFTELSLNDQMRLLQSTWAEILTLTLTYRSLSCTGKLRFASDFTLDEKQARECGAIELYQHVSKPEPKIKNLYYIITILAHSILYLISLFLPGCGFPDNTSTLRTDNTVTCLTC